MKEFVFYLKIILAVVGTVFYFLKLLYLIFKPKFLGKYTALTISSKQELVILYLLFFSICVLELVKLF